MKLAFSLSLLTLVYVCFGYPFILLFLSRLFGRTISKSGKKKSVSVLIAAKNEEIRIGNKIENLLAQKYPGIEIIIVCDGCTDMTSNIVKEIARRLKEDDECPNASLKLIEYTPSRGKAYALNFGAKYANGDIIVFSDVRQVFKEKSIEHLVSRLSESNVGCVSGQLVLLDPFVTSTFTGASTYWNYETRIRKMESRLHSIPGATGAIYAIRKELFTTIPEGLLLDDVYIPMHVVLKGYRCIFEENAIAFDYPSRDLKSERRRKIRTLLGNWQLILIMPSLLIPFRNPIFFQYFSHKILRLFLPFLLIAILVTSSFNSVLFYCVLFWFAIVFFILPNFCSIFKRFSLIMKISEVSQSFANLMYCAAIAFFYFLIGKREVW